MNVLTAEHLRFAYGRRAVVDDVTLSIAPGRAAVLAGPSGAGKTTLLWLLAGLLRPHGGRRRSPGPDEPIGMVFQQPTLWAHLHVADHLKLVLAGKGLSRRVRRSRVEATLEQMGLTALAGRRPGKLSGGERQRVALARALVVEPRWLLLDEPLAHLDGPARDELFVLLRAALAQTRAGVLLATHNTDEAMRIADDVIVMLDGRIRQQGPARRVYDSPTDLETARVLGPAAELAGVARDGALWADGRPILENLAPTLTGPQRFILRPHWIRFCPDPAGPAEILRCDDAGSGYLLDVRLGANRLTVFHPTPESSGDCGRITAMESCKPL